MGASIRVRGSRDSINQSGWGWLQPRVGEPTVRPALGKRLNNLTGTLLPRRGSEFKVGDILITRRDSSHAADVEVTQ